MAAEAIFCLALPIFPPRLQITNNYEKSKKFQKDFWRSEDSDDNDEETEKHATVETSGLPKSAPKTFNQIMESLDESQEETARAPQGF